MQCEFAENGLKGGEKLLACSLTEAFVQIILRLCFCF